MASRKKKGQRPEISFPKPPVEAFNAGTKCEVQIILCPDATNERGLDDFMEDVCPIGRNTILETMEIRLANLILLRWEVGKSYLSCRPHTVIRPDLTRPVDKKFHGCNVSKSIAEDSQ